MSLRRQSRLSAGVPTGLPGSLPGGGRWGVGRIVLVYAVFAGLWVLLSDRAVRWLFHDPSAMMMASSLKGLLFIGLTSALLFFTLRRHVLGLEASERIFANMFRLAPDAVDVTHLDSGVCLDLNQTFQELYGYSREEMLGRSTLPGALGLWTDPADRERFVAEIKAKGSVHGGQALMRRKDGSVFHAFISSAVLDIGGDRYNLSLTRDMTEQKRAEEALRESSRRLELATASASLGVWDRNIEARTLIWNDRMYELYGLKRQPGVPDFERWYQLYIHPEDIPATDEAVAAALRGDRPYEIEFRTLHPDGTIRHITANGLVLRNAEGRPIRIIGINRDRTQEVEAAAEQRRLQAELQHAEKLESLGSLAGGVAHDMNNVLAAIMGVASAIRAAHPEQDPLGRPMDTIIRACTRGRDVVKSLLYFARKDPETIVPVDLNTLAGEMVQLLTYTTLKRVRVTTDFQVPLGLIEGDTGALGNVLINLCVNAVDAMPEGGTLEVRTRRRSVGSIELSVKDSGQGMSAEVARRAIEPFFTTKPAGKGTGLGLAMVYGTVMAHKGTFEIRTAPGQGTEVLLGFPALPETQPEPCAPVAEPEAPSADPMRILLVDDDELIRHSVGPMLTALGHEVHTAESGQEALDRLRAGLQVDLVVLDMNMPGLTGAQTLARLQEWRPDQTVLMATGYSDAAIAPLLEGRPNVFSLHKPFSINEIRTKLGSIPRPGRNGEA